MDLDRCPKCGNAWQGGDKCRKCGFVPIGAGLDKLPKKRKRRAGRYVEPGSARGLLSFILLGALGYGCFVYQPWQDDWELVRAWFGQGRHHSVVGEWEIVKTVSVKRDQAYIAARKIQKGALKFTDAGKVDVTLEKGGDKTLATGKYLVSGTLVAMNDLTLTAAGAGEIPKTMKVNLSWTGPDTVIATTPGEAIYLRRKTGPAGIAKLLQMGVKPDKAEVPGQMRGVVATMQSSISNEEKDN